MEDLLTLPMESGGTPTANKMVQRFKETGHLVPKHQCFESRNPKDKQEADVPFTSMEILQTQNSGSKQFIL